jgi:hypothetical protein
MQLEAACGSAAELKEFLQNGQVLRLLITPPAEGSDGRPNDFVDLGGYRLWRLRGNGGEQLLGLLGVAARGPGARFSSDEEKVVETLLGQAEAALQDRHLQQGVFAALRSIIPEIERIQRWRGQIRYLGSSSLHDLLPEASLASQPDFRQWVREALRHYWGGPKLARSPLLGLRIVTQALQEHENNPLRALRAVLRRAIEYLRPDGTEQRMTAPEWLLYNILDLRFIQRRQVREIARNLAMSESDLYRKQRVAIDEVARVLADMEVSEVMQANGGREADESIGESGRTGLEESAI